MTGVRVILYGAPAAGRTTFAPRRGYAWACEITADQRALIAELIARTRVAPVAIKPALRGRRRGW